MYFSLRIANGVNLTTPITIYPMMILPSETDYDFEEYNGQTYSATFSNTEYGGSYDFVSGEGQGEWGYIASYNGETLPSEWISDRDVYAPNTTPTTGAEVAYKLATPTSFSTTPTPIPLNKGTNVVSTDADDLELKYSVG